ncbi:MAG: hybrid sensor histidine kinase/response regulator, partial [Candidatus Competibacteraceae bacterium]|nr:hybrid sensor histidine kinase/response regulator [Candidatus Competibacteraceae bacterium]
DRLTGLSRDIRRRETFLDLLAHELRNPLAALRHVLDACRLRQNAGQPDPEGVAIMSGQLQQATQLVDELLDAGRLARREISLEKAPVVVADVVGRAVEATDPLMRERGHTLELTLPKGSVRLLGDRDRLVQVVTQLLSNAARYTPEGKPIRLMVEVDEGAVVLRVREDGRGIPPGRLGRIFEPFAAMDEDAEPPRGGLGLGLSVARRLVELHGGRITVRSAGDGRGSEFEVSLPLPEGTVPARIDPGPDAVTVAAPVMRRVLVVDDDEAVANTLARLLGALGHQAKAVYRGQEALQAVRTWQPEVVLLDLEMPYMDGYEVAQRLRENHGPQLRLVALTGHGRETHLRRARKAGFDRYLLKPVFVEDLQALLAQEPAIAGPRADSHR